MRTPGRLSPILAPTALGVILVLAACERPAPPPPAAAPAPDVAAEPAPGAILDPADALSKNPIDVLAMKWNGKWVPIALSGGECKLGELPPDHRTCRMPGQMVRWQVYDVIGLTTPGDVGIEIRFKDKAKGDPVEDEGPASKCLGVRPNGIVKCKVKADAAGEYAYTVILDGGEIDPRIVVNPNL